MRRKYARRVPAVFTRLICVFRLRNRSAKKYKKEGARRRRPIKIQQAGIRNRGGEDRYIVSMRFSPVDIREKEKNSDSTRVQGTCVSVETKVCAAVVGRLDRRTSRQIQPGLY